MVFENKTKYMSPGIKLITFACLCIAFLSITHREKLTTLLAFHLAQLTFVTLYFILSNSSITTFKLSTTKCYYHSKPLYHSISDWGSVLYRCIFISPSCDWNKCNYIVTILVFSDHWIMTYIIIYHGCICNIAKGRAISISTYISIEINILRYAQ